MTLLIKPIPWDTAALYIPAWELLEYSEAALQQAANTPGHHTLRVDPLADKRWLYEHGFYYCDTLIEPHCQSARLRMMQHPDATISREIDAAQAMSICHGAFSYGRFHRDFNLPKSAADLRYDNWFKQLLKAQQAYGLYWQGALAGFICYNDNNLVLHALSSQYSGRGLSKYWWSAVCREIFAAGYSEVKSSISATNIAALNLYTSLGFSFCNPKDIYHRLVP